MSIIKSELKVGDFLKVFGVDGEEWYAVIVNTTDGIHVEYLSEDGYYIDERKSYKFDGEFYPIDIESIMEHMTGDLRRAMFYYGFVRKTKDVWVKYNTDRPVEEDTISVEYLSDNDEYASDSDSDNSDDMGSLKDFIVPDEEGERFTEATCDNDFVNEVHSAVTEYNDWVPLDDLGRGVKNTIDKIEQKARFKEDDLNF